MLLLGLGFWAPNFSKDSDESAVSTLNIMSPLTSTRAWGFIATTFFMTLFFFVIYYRGFEYFQRFRDGWDQIPNLKYLFTAVDLRVSNVFISWYSATILILAGVAASLCFGFDNLLFRKQGISKPVVGWLILGLCCWGLALNEANGFAKQLSLPNPATEKSLLEPSVIIAFWVPLALVSLFFVIFIFSHIRIKENQVSFALILLGGALILLPYFLIGVEPILRLGVGDKRPFLITLAENGMRLFGE